MKNDNTPPSGGQIKAAFAAMIAGFPAGKMTGHQLQSLIDAGKYGILEGFWRRLLRHKLWLRLESEGYMQVDVLNDPHLYFSYVRERSDKAARSMLDRLNRPQLQNRPGCVRFITIQELGFDGWDSSELYGPQAIHYLEQFKLCFCDVYDIFRVMMDAELPKGLRNILPLYHSQGEKHMWKIKSDNREERGLELHSYKPGMASPFHLDLVMVRDLPTS